MRRNLLVAILLMCPAAPAVAQPADLQYVGDTLSLEVPFAESKEAVHRVILNCRNRSISSQPLSAADPSAEC